VSAAGTARPLVLHVRVGDRLAVADRVEQEQRGPGEWNPRSGNRTGRERTGPSPWNSPSGRSASRPYTFETRSPVGVHRSRSTTSRRVSAPLRRSGQCWICGNGSARRRSRIRRGAALLILALAHRPSQQRLPRRCLAWEAGVSRGIGSGYSRTGRLKSSIFQPSSAFRKRQVRSNAVNRTVATAVVPRTRTLGTRTR
jgi:hypothetical protein